jgi:uncharacterized membrane protein YbhN (UPF0104 family)
MTAGWRWARLTGGAGILAILVWRLGTGPIVDGLRTVDWRALTAAVAIGAFTTVCCVWRWKVVARGLSVDVPTRAGIAAYYRSQFLNTTLPGGVLGDVHRGVRSGRDVGDVGSGLRAVAWERCAGQAVQAVVSAVALLLLPSPVRSSMPGVVVAAIAGVAGVVLVGRALTRGTKRSRWIRALRVAVSEIRATLLTKRSWPRIVLASTLVVAGHTTVFLVAARTAGSSASLIELVPLALLVLLAMGVPTNIGGWGPREGVAAWGFGLAGLTAAQGVATAVVYGVLVFVAGLPGAALLLRDWLRGDAPHRKPDVVPVWREPAAVAAVSGTHG